MRNVTLILLSVLAASNSVAIGRPEAGDGGLSLVQEFDAFKLEYAKPYARDSAEHAQRFAIFQTNWRFIQAHNERFASGHESYRLAINTFADQTLEEVTGGCLLRPSNDSRTLTSHGAATDALFDSTDDVDLPASKDWRSMGAVTPVKNQGDCSSCWAFSATGALEAAHFLATGELVSLSEQNLVDCSWAQGNDGCKGGHPIKAFEYVWQYGIDTEQSYPYEAKDAQCRFSSENIGATIRKYSRLSGEKQLMRAVAYYGPVSVAVEATSSFRFFEGTEVFVDRTCGSNLNHAMLVVGYGTLNGLDYWLVKNSWGTDWGDGGYAKVLRNYNHCGIGDWVSVPVV